MNKKARKSAIKSLLTMSNSNNRVTLLDKLDFDKISTRDFAAFMKKFDLERALIVAVDPSQNLLLSARNVPYVKLLKADGLNVYDILKYRNLIFTENSVRIVEGVLQ
jgi:large subunit ribosomal protein L4